MADPYVTAAVGLAVLARRRGRQRAAFDRRIAKVGGPERIVEAHPLSAMPLSPEP